MLFIHPRIVAWEGLLDVLGLGEDGGSEGKLDGDNEG